MKVAFAVDRATDVAVYIETSKGRIVRHLAAGVLGEIEIKADETLELPIEFPPPRTLAA